AQQQALRRAFGVAYEEVADAWAKTLVSTAESIRNKADETSLVITSGPGWPQRERLIGLFMTWLFLSLGGPFWYTILRQLANLRPVIAGKVDKEKSDK